MRVAQCLNVFLFALVAGVFWGTWFSLSRSIASITPGTFLEVGRTMIQNLARPMSLLVPAAILSAVPVLVVLFRRGRMPALYLVSAALLFFMGALLITLLVNVPIDRQIEQWTVATLPPDWEGVRDRWQHYHTLRTFISLAGLGLALAGLAVSNRSSVRGATTG